MNRAESRTQVVKALWRRLALLIPALLWLGSQQALAQPDPAHSPAYFAAEIIAFTHADASDGNACAALFLGSSSIRMWRGLESDMAPFAVVNRGFGGSTINDVNHYFAALVGRRAPPAIFFYAGENDIAMGQPPSNVVAAFRQFLDLKSRALGATPVYFVSLKPSPLRFEQVAAQAQVNNAIRRLARSRRDLHFVDVASAMMDHGEPRDIFLPDRLHMNEEGYAIWTRILRPLVSREMRRVACGTARAPESAVLRVMSYNIRLDTEADGDNAWSHRRAALSGLMRFYAPDIFGLQEVRLHQRDQLASDLADYAFLGVGRDDGREGGEFSSLAFRRDRFRLIAQGGFWLSPTPDRPSRGWDAAYPRIVTWAHLRDLRSGGRLLALNTHWDHIGAVARLESGKMIRDWIDTHRIDCESVVLIGDFNAPPSEASYQSLVQSRALLDSRGLSETPPFGPAGTFNGFDIMRADAAPIDHILVSARVRVIRHGVLTQHNGGRLPSDHYPILADIAAPRCRA